jgi:hypothetical protein
MGEAGEQRVSSDQSDWIAALLSLFIYTLMDYCVHQQLRQLVGLSESFSLCPIFEYAGFLA